MNVNEMYGMNVNEMNGMNGMNGMMSVEMEDDERSSPLLLIFMVLLIIFVLIYFNWDFVMNKYKNFSQAKEIKHSEPQTYTPEKIIIVRGSDFKDNQLTDDGKKRSIELVDKLKSISKHIDHIYTLDSPDLLLSAFPSAFSFQAPIHHTSCDVKSLVKGFKENPESQDKILLLLHHFVDTQDLLNNILGNKSVEIPNNEEYNFYIIKNNKLTIQKEY